VYADRPRLFVIGHLLPRISAEAIEVSTKPGKVQCDVLGLTVVSAAFSGFSGSRLLLLDVLGDLIDLLIESDHGA
jgi:hypothetical protein